MKRYRVTVDGETYEVEVEDARVRPVVARIGDETFLVDVEADGSRRTCAGGRALAGRQAGTRRGSSARTARPRHAACTHSRRGHVGGRRGRSIGRARGSDPHHRSDEDVQCDQVTAGWNDCRRACRRQSTGLAGGHPRDVRFMSTVASSQAAATSSLTRVRRAP